MEATNAENIQYYYYHHYDHYRLQVMSDGVRELLKYMTDHPHPGMVFICLTLKFKYTNRYRNEKRASATAGKSYRLPKLLQTFTDSRCITDMLYLRASRRTEQLPERKYSKHGNILSD